MQHSDVILIGGGLAGLSLAIQLADSKRRVMLLEKNKYPFHRVCGEYISMESWDFLQRLGLPLFSMNLPRISRLKISSSNGKYLEQDLDLGGFGISRYLLDASLAQLAKAKGVEVIEECRADDITKDKDTFHVTSSKGNFSGAVVIGAFGKRSNLDKKLNRSFEKNPQPPSKNWIGVKYHLSLPQVIARSEATNPSPASAPDQSYFADDTIELHNFDDGYCGISKVEGEKYCLCYLTKAENLLRHQGKISEMEDKLLSQNPFLKKYFSLRENFLFKEPVTISQITFEKKLPVENNVLMLGDAAGMIAPLFGNGMSMALHASSILFPLVKGFLKGKISRSDMQQQYSQQWEKLFARRLQRGRIIQPLMVQSGLSNIAIPFLKAFPGIMKTVVKSTHGSPF